MNQLHRLLHELKSKNDNDESEWLSVSDLMSGLMILFMFIAISLIMETQKVAQTYQENQKSIYQALMNEFQKDLNKMGAEIDPKTLTVIFNSPDILFETGQSELKPNYQTTLADFFPRYMRVLSQYQQSIDEIRIEGHTSSEWNNNMTGDFAYFENMRLSQDRTRAVLNYVYHLENVKEYRPWIKEHLAAVGLSSAKILKDAQQQEDKVKSKRVTFRIITNSDETMQKLLGDK